METYNHPVTGNIAGTGTGTGTGSEGADIKPDITTSMPAPSTLKRRRSSSRSPPQRHRQSEDQERERKRGRPRVDRANDPSAADRRRTQIREAQRAYRARKETTLETLRVRVTELSSALTRVNNTFAAYHQKVLSSGGRLTQLQRRALLDTAADFEQTLQSVGPLTTIEGDVDSTTPSASSAPKSISESTPETVQSILDANKYSAPDTNENKVQQVDQDETINHINPGQDLTSWLEPATLALTKRPRQGMDSNNVNTIYHNEQYPPPGPLPSDMYMFGRPNSSSHPSSSRRARRINNIVPSPRHLEQLPLPLSFSSSESMFARRLHRACLEQSQVLLADPSILPLTYDRVFRCSTIGTTNDCMQCTPAKRLLQYGVDGALNLWQQPQVHVGGAGTHFTPREPNNSNIFAATRKKPTFAGTFEVSERRPLWTAYNAPFSGDVTIDIDLDGYEGVWFDPYDVQGYIEEKGIFIRPGEPYVEIEIVQSSLPLDIPSSRQHFVTTNGTAASENGRIIPRPEHAEQLYDGEQLQVLNKIGAHLERYNAGMMFRGAGYSASIEQQLRLQQQQQQQQQDDQHIHSPSSAASSNAWQPMPQFSNINPSINGNIHIQPDDATPILDGRGYQPTQNDLMFATSQESTVSSCAPTMAEAHPAVANEVHGVVNASEDPSIGGMYALASMFTREAPTLPEPQKKNAMVDIDQFVRVLTIFGVCLGSGAPCFRRRDIDRALAMASWDI